MNWKNTSARYATPLIALHWLMLLLIVGVYAAINLHEVAAKGSDLRANLKTLHFGLGLSVFVLVAVRLMIRWFSGPPPRIEPRVPVWQHRLAMVVQLALYGLMIGMPLLGWFAVSAKGAPIAFFGWQLPLLISTDKGLYDSLKEIHGNIGTVGYFLIGLHAAAALFHHYVLRDSALVQMLPRSGRPRSPPRAGV